MASERFLKLAKVTETVKENGVNHKVQLYFIKEKLEKLYDIFNSLALLGINHYKLELTKEEQQCIDLQLLIVALKEEGFEVVRPVIPEDKIIIIWNSPEGE